uniref:Uncharacterized protein n=1 Tax=Setaria viridis TaxID=4556 RepID=A0A4U6W6L5_SETVI|nr:hypothetical protein SEVIR_1G103250v2 [Setaria viridis]
MVLPRRPMTPPTWSAGTTSRNTLAPGHPGHRCLASSPSSFLSATAVCAGSSSVLDEAGKGSSGSSAGRSASGSGSESEDGTHGSTTSGSSSSSTPASGMPSIAASSSCGGDAMAEGFRDAAERSEWEQSLLVFSGWFG